MLPSLLPLPASFFKVLTLPQKFNRFYRFQLSLPQPSFQPKRFVIIRSKILYRNLNMILNVERHKQFWVK